MIQRLMLPDMLVKEIKKYIVENDLKDGDKLPNQQQLCDMFGVSRTSLREALRTLQAISLIEIKNGKGIYVKGIPKLTLNAAASSADDFQTLMYILEIRRGIEGMAVKFAAQRATDEDIMEMERLLKIMQEKASNGECHPDEDRAFHVAIYKATKNPVLMELIQNTYTVFGMLWKNPLGMGHALNSGIGLHTELFNCIRDRKPKEAERVFNKLVDDIELIAKNI